MNPSVEILLVDDESQNLVVLESILESPDYRLVRAQSADAALIALLSGEFACIVLDVHLPDMSGIELARLIKTRRRSQHIPIIFLTAYLHEEKDVLQGYGAGAVDYLTKPINPQILRLKVAVFADLFRATRALTAANAALELEVAERKKAEAALCQINLELETRVTARTADLVDANRELRENEERYRLILENILEYAVFTIDKEGLVTGWSAGAERILGFHESQVLGSPLDFVYVGEDRERGQPRLEMERALAVDRAQDERWHVRKDGSRFWATGLMMPLKDPEGRHRGFLKLLRDRTARKRAEEARDHLLAIIESSEDAIISQDLNGVIRSWNPAAERLFGYAAEEAIGQPISMLIPPDRVQEEVEILQRLRQGEHIEDYETIRLRKNGAPVDLCLTISALRDAAGQILGVAKILRDITDRKRAEEALRRNHEDLEDRVRMRTAQLAQVNHSLQAQIREREQLEALVLSISEREQQRIGQDLHDGLCQHLTGIKFMTGLLEQKLARRAGAEAEDARAMESLLSKAIEQARSLARGLNPVCLEADGLSSALQELAGTVTGMFGVRCDWSWQAPVVLRDHAVSIHLYRIAQEAITNAIKHGRAKRISIQLADDDGLLRLTVLDDGIGFSISGEQKSGMGLRIMSSRARAIGGSLEVRRETAGGTAVICSVACPALRVPTALRRTPVCQ